MAQPYDDANEAFYRPLSLYALAGFGMSCLFAAVIVASAFLALVQGSAFFLWEWMLLLPAAGFLISWCGLSEVRNSEGTKAGQKLAVYGMWLGLIAGSGYFAYSYFTGLALSQQVVAFFMNVEDQSGFFPRLQKGSADRVEFNRAFLLSIPPGERSRVQPENEDALRRSFDQGQEGTPGPLSRFRMNHLVMAVSLYGPKAIIEPLGMHTWKYDKRSYQVAYLFRVKTPEAVADVVLTAKSSEGESEGQNRQWFVDMTTVQHNSLEQTPLGRGLKILREHAGPAVQNLEHKIRDAKKKGIKLPAFESIDLTDWSSFDAELRQELKPRVTAIFNGETTDGSWHFNVSRDKMPFDGEQDAAGRWTLTVPLTLMLAKVGGEMGTGMEGKATVRTKAPFDAEKIGAADATAVQMPEWELQSVKFLRYQSKKK